MALFSQNDAFISYWNHSVSDFDSTYTILGLKACQSQHSFIFSLFGKCHSLPTNHQYDCRSNYWQSSVSQRLGAQFALTEVTILWPCEKHLGAWREKSQFTANRGNLSICSHLSVWRLTQWALIYNSAPATEISERQREKPTRRTTQRVKHAWYLTAFAIAHWSLNLLRFLWPDFRRAKHFLSAGCGLCCRLMLK